MLPYLFDCLEGFISGVTERRDYIIVGLLNGGGIYGLKVMYVSGLYIHKK